MLTKASETFASVSNMNLPQIPHMTIRYSLRAGPKLGAALCDFGDTSTDPSEPTVRTDAQARAGIEFTSRCFQGRRGVGSVDFEYIGENPGPRHEEGI